MIWTRQGRGNQKNSENDRVLYINIKPILLVFTLDLSKILKLFVINILKSLIEVKLI